VADLLVLFSQAHEEQRCGGRQNLTDDYCGASTVQDYYHHYYYYYYYSAILRLVTAFGSIVLGSPRTLPAPIPGAKYRTYYYYYYYCLLPSAYNVVIPTDSAVFSLGPHTDTHRATVCGSSQFFPLTCLPALTGLPHYSVLPA
jgi:hypothetical protein